MKITIVCMIVMMCAAIAVARWVDEDKQEFNEAGKIWQKQQLSKAGKSHGAEEMTNAAEEYNEAGKIWLKHHLSKAGESHREEKKMTNAAEEYNEAGKIWQKQQAARNRQRLLNPITGEEMKGGYT